MLIINSTYGSFTIPDNTELSIYVTNRQVITWTDPETGKEESFEKGNLIFETDLRIYSFTEMIEPLEYYWEYLENIPYGNSDDDPCLWDKETTELYIDAFDPEHHYSTLTIESKPPRERILHNRIRCNLCGDIIESYLLHDFIRCGCAACAVDGGHYYLRRICSSEDCYTELSVIGTAPDADENCTSFAAPLT